MTERRVETNAILLARELEAMAQTGLHYAVDPFDEARYRRLREIAAGLLADASGLAVEEIRGWSAAEFGYATPKVDVRAFILAEDRVLLLREDSDGGRWTLPGGWADVNESPAEAVAREVLEESGYQVEVKGLLGVLDRTKQGHRPPFPYHVYKLFFHCAITGGAPRPTEESSESGFFAIDELPALSESRVLPGQLRRFFAMLKSGDRSAAYD